MLYLDLLGVKARWQQGGGAAAVAAYDALRRFIRTGLAALPRERRELVRGGMQSDAAALIFPRVDEAIVAGRVIYQAAFQGPLSETDERFWLRGAITSCDLEDPLWNTSPLADDLSLTDARPSAALLDAIAVEQSGYRGMRLLIDKQVAHWTIRKEFDIVVGAGAVFRTIRQMKFNALPASVSDRFVDVLWMLPDDLADWPLQKRRILDRVRWAALHPEELSHASLTLVIFEGCGALLESLCRVHGWTIDAVPIGRRNMPESARTRVQLALAEEVATRQTAIAEIAQITQIIQ
jgi:hypothetical protein